MIEKVAYAADGAGQAAPANPIFSFMPLILLALIFYLLLIRPQQKRQRETQEMIKALKKGDRIITVGGIVGTITSLQDDYVVIKTGEGDSKMEILKNGISGLRNPVKQEKK